jgi:prophage regulatory protein
MKNNASLGVFTPKSAAPPTTAPYIQTLHTALIHHKATALIRRKEVERLIALSRSRLYVLMATGDFPRPVSLGAKSVAWCEVEVHDWIAARIADRALAA